MKRMVSGLLEPGKKLARWTTVGAMSYWLKGAVKSPELNENMKRILTREIITPYGDILLGSLDNHLCLCDWKYRSARQSIDSRISKFLEATYIPGNSDILDETEHQLDEYFSGKRETFDIPLTFAGSSFQIKVWKELKEIPYGKTKTYLGLSQSIRNEKAVRAVAAANGANALAIIVPCHRVIGNNGQLTGYAGGLAAKKRLLQLEQRSRGNIQTELFN